MFNGNIKIKNREIPKTLLGTSPFIGAAQFGHRARLYQLDLYQKTENMVKIIKKSYDLGVKGIQVIPYENVIKALKIAINDGCELEIVGTIRPDKEDEDIETFTNLGVSSMLLHAVITDSGEWEFIAKKLDLIRDSGSIPGIVTHMPFRTTKNLLKSPIIDLFDIYMVPINKLGYLMDTSTFMEDSRTELRNLILELDKIIIAKKILAAGVLKPMEAFDFLKNLDYVDMVTVGIASEKEAEESFNLLERL
ncbi:MAG: hypothetical protein QME14_04815 [Methanobacteriaceae archaeon]|nr:hypothetical protein [Methanobacteriaceae archaeon]